MKENTHFMEVTTLHEFAEFSVIKTDGTSKRSRSFVSAWTPTHEVVLTSNNPVQLDDLAGIVGFEVLILGDMDDSFIIQEATVNRNRAYLVSTTAQVAFPCSIIEESQAFNAVNNVEMYKHQEKER